MQILFAWDASGGADDRVAEAVTRPTVEEPHKQSVRKRALEMARGAWIVRRDVEQRINTLSPKWPMRRQPATDRCVLLLGTWELLHGDAPGKTVINDCVELAKTFGGPDSGKFVNALLDEVMKSRDEQYAGLTEL